MYAVCQVRHSLARHARGAASQNAYRKDGVCHVVAAVSLDEALWRPPMLSLYLFDDLLRLSCTNLGRAMRR